MNDAIKLLQQARVRVATDTDPNCRAGFWILSNAIRYLIGCPRASTVEIFGSYMGDGIL